MLSIRSLRAEHHHLTLNNRIAPLLCLAALLLAGCGATVTMREPTIPVPRMERIPVDVALRIPTEFEHYVHEEEVLGKESWTIDLGRSNAALFEQLFGFMFDSVIVLGPDDDARDFQFDALVEPTIEGFEFSVPAQSKAEEFAVWIRYRMAIYDSAGTHASNYTVSAHGKSQKEGLGGSDSLRRAAILAMRDAAALIIMQMDKATKISALANGPIDPLDAVPGELQADADTESDAGEAEEDFSLFAIGGIDDDGF